MAEVRVRVVVAGMLCVLGGAMLAAPLAAQGADSVVSARAADALARVRRLTSSDVGGARSVADSLVNALPAESSAMPEALFARASIAASAAEAERDYTRIVTDFRFAPKVPDALMRLAVLESARNNRAGALKHLDRLLRDHGDSPARSRASLLAGRIRMDMNDPARACDLLAAAYASATALERDVRDQAVTAGARCPVPVETIASRDPAPMGVMRAPKDVPAPTPAPTAPSRTASRTPPARVTPQKPVVTPPAPTTVATASAPPPPDVTATPPAPRRDTTPVTVPTPAPTPAATPAAPPAPTTPAPSVTAAPTPTPALVVPPRAPTPAPAPTPTASVDARFAVQFAAYNDKPGAEQYATVLRGRGIVARVEGERAPFRVRAGRYATRTEAEAAAALWRRPGTAAIVVPFVIPQP